MKSTLLIFFLWMGLPALVNSQLLPDSLWQRALEKHPGLEASRLAVAAALTGEQAVGGWPSVEIQGGVFTRPMEFPAGNQRFELEIMQMLPQPGMWRAERNEAAAMTSARNAQLEETARMLRMQLTEAWINWLAVHEEIQIRSEILETTKQLHILAEQRVHSGGMMSDVIRSQIRLLEMETELTLTQTQIAVYEQQLWSLAGDGSPFPIPKGDFRLNSNFKPVVNTHFTMEHPAVRMLLADAEAASARYEMQMTALKPMFGVGVQYMPLKGHPGMGRHDMFMPMASVSIPVSRKKTRLRADVARLDEQRLQHEAAQKKSDLLIVLKDALSLYESATTMEEATKSRELLIQQLYDVSLTEFQSGDTGMEMLLDILESQITVRLNRIQAHKEMQMAAAKLEELEIPAFFTHENH